MATVAPNRSTTEADLLRQAVLRHVTYSLAATPDQLTPREAFRAVALTIRDRMVDGLLATEKRYRKADAKRLYYLSLEFLIGRSLVNNLVNLSLLEPCRDMLRGLGIDLGDVEESEVDAALGNGGLGRLAACFLDSLATLGLAGFGYGINYEYGLFRQEIKGGQQVEKPDNWRIYGAPWEIECPRDAVLVPLYGRVEHGKDRFGNYNPMWLDWKVIIGVPHDVPVVGYGGRTVNYLRLFSARASHEVDMDIFNEGDYLKAVRQKVESETVSKVLYPSDWVAAGRELRLVQEYFLVACAVRDIMRRYQQDHDRLDSFADKVAVQLNDTHPALTVAELMRVFIDENDMPWERAWELTTATCAYTNHTLLPEALERWPVPLFEKVLPRHLQIIYEINQRFLGAVAERWPGDGARQQRMSLIEEGDVKQVRMANLAIVGSHSVNGVAAVHSDLVKKELVPDFAALTPEKFNNKTNGVTPRRWLLAANPELAALITDAVGDDWITQLDRLRELEVMADDSACRDRSLAIKRANKERLAKVIRDTSAEAVVPDSMFDIQIKRIHEYKRQLLNLLHVVHEYLSLVDEGREPLQPRTFVFAGKAAPGYMAAKQIIHLINDVAAVIDHDRRVRELIKVVFIPDYRVSLAEVIIPAADLSEQVSTAGTEASGTGNMKFAMNGALTIGTLDGANIEIREAVGAENFFLFGLTVGDVQRRLAQGYRPDENYRSDEELRAVVDAISDGTFSNGDRELFKPIVENLLGSDPYMLLADYRSYLDCQEEVGRVWQDAERWTRSAILNVARMGRFSSDRSIREYCRDIWHLSPVPIPD